MALKSIKFPFQQGDSSFPASADDDEAIRSSIVIILSTTQGERPHRPSFGVRTIDMLFETTGESLSEGLSREIRSALTAWEPRISIESIVVSLDDVANPGEIDVAIYYVNLLTRRRDQIKMEF